MRIKVTSFIILLCATFALLIFHPFFHIKNIDVQGLQRIEKDEFLNAVRGIIWDDTLLFALPKKNYFFVDVEEVRDILKDRFSLSTIRVTKIFPHTLSIEVEEKLSTIIYDNGTYYAYLGVDGNIVEHIRRVGDDEWTKITKMVTSTNEHGELITEEKVVEEYHIPKVRSVQAEAGSFPIAYDKGGRDKTGSVNEQALQPQFAQHIIEWFTFLTKEAQLPFYYVVVDNGLGDARIIMEEGWEIRVQLSQETDQQFRSLIYLLKEKISSTKGLRYIDVRFQDRLYWQ